MPEATESILRRIEKCLALSNSSNEHEAAAALRQATKLMAAYNVSQSDLAAAKITVEDALTDAWAKPPGWEMRLVGVLNRAFGTDAILLKGNSEFRVLTRVLYVGPSHQAKLAAYAHAVLRRQVVAARARFISKMPVYKTRGEKIAAGESYCSGYVNSLHQQVSDLALDADQLKAREAVKERLLGGPPGETADYKPPNVGNDELAYWQGRNEGKKAKLHRGVDQTEQLKLGKD